MKRFPWYAWLAVFGLAMLLFNVLAFGGMTLLPGAGPAAVAQARREQPLTHTYMVVGRHVLDTLPALRVAARGLAETAWKDALPVMREQPLTAADRMFDSGSGVVYGLVRVSFWGALPVLLLALLGWWRRPRAVSLIGPGMRRRG